MKIDWQQTGNDPDDLKAEPQKGHMLRVEKMNEKETWWCVYIGDESWDSWFGKRAKTVDEAKQFCEEKYLEVIESPAGSGQVRPTQKPA